jgi:predicted Fe-S protein YdhL (DUF1289 family)
MAYCIPCVLGQQQLTSWRPLQDELKQEILSLLDGHRALQDVKDGVLSDKKKKEVLEELRRDAELKWVRASQPCFVMVAAIGMLPFRCTTAARRDCYHVRSQCLSCS